MFTSDDDNARRIRQLTRQRENLADIPLEQWMREYAESLEWGPRRVELLAHADKLKAGIENVRAWIDDEIERLKKLGGKAGK